MVGVFTTKLVTAPSIEPVSLETAKARLRVDAGDEDAAIAEMIKAARQSVENATGRAFITQTWDMWLDAFPTQWGTDTPIEIIPGPVQSISYLKYTDIGSVLRTMVSGTDYRSDISSIPARIFPGATGWAVSGIVPNAVNVRFVAGYGLDATDVPHPIIQEILTLVDYLYENRSSSDYAFSNILTPYRSFWV